MTMPKLRVLGAILVAFAVVASPGTALAQDGSGTGGAEVLGTMFGLGGDLGSVGPSDNVSIIEAGWDLSMIDPVTGAVVGEDLDSYVTDQMAQLDALASSDQLSAEALRAAERARLEAMRRKRTRLPASVPYAELFEESGARHGVDPSLLAAVAQTESGFRPEIISCQQASPAGARGLMQFMPSTASGRGVDPCDPASAIDGAARMLAELYAKYGNWDLALAAYNAGPGAVDRFGGIPPYAETQNYVRKVNDAWASYASQALAEGQGEVGAEGCSTTSAANTLRDGAESVGIYEICRRSVEAARTPEAARAIINALSPAFLGKPYSQPRRNSSGYYDCSSYVTRAYTVGGLTLAPPGQNAPTTFTIHPARWARQVPLSQALPGDLVLPSEGHVGMVLADGWMVHTNRTGDISHVRRLYSSAWKVVWVDPAAV
jgi:cell wall-associated NlpC family hydrolase